MPKEDCQDRPDLYLMSITPGGKKKNEEKGRTLETGKKQGRRETLRGEQTQTWRYRKRGGNVKAESECDRHMGRGGAG